MSTDTDADPRSPARNEDPDAWRSVIVPHRDAPLQHPPDSAPRVIAPSATAVLGLERDLDGPAYLALHVAARVTIPLGLLVVPVVLSLGQDAFVVRHRTSISPSRLGLVALGTFYLLAVWLGAWAAARRARSVGASPWWCVAIAPPLFGDLVALVLAFRPDRRPGAPSDATIGAALLGLLWTSIPMGGVLAIVALPELLGLHAEWTHPTHSVLFCALALFLLGWLTASVRRADGRPVVRGSPAGFGSALEAAFVGLLLAAGALSLGVAMGVILEPPMHVPIDGLGFVFATATGTVVGAAGAIAASPCALLGAATWWLLVGRPESRRRV